VSPADRDALALFVQFVRMNPQIPANDPTLPDVLRAYAKTCAEIAIPISAVRA
jgi:hypothetical protein